MSPRTIPEALDVIFERHGQAISFIDKQAFRRQAWTYAKTKQQVDQMVAFLSNKQLTMGDAVAICAPNGPWWLICYLACAKLGIIVVPLDFNSSSDFIDTILRDTNAKLLCKSVYKPYTGSVETILLEDLAQLTDTPASANPTLPEIQADTTLEIVFTSGSTGTPKGVVLTHGNVMSNVSNFLAAWPKQRHQTSLSLVPLSHMLEQTAGFWAPFTLGFTIVYIASLRPSAIAAAIKDEQVTNIITVPAFLQLLRRRIQGQLEQPTLSAGFARLLVRSASKLPRPLARQLTLPIRAKLGAQLETLAVGGAALPVDVEQFWTNLGYYVIQGYGLTETSPLATYSSSKELKLSSVGKSLPGQELRIAEGGELLLRGSHVFKGYYNNDDATQTVIDKDGWLHTGDIAVIDEQGFVFLKGRLKNMLLGSNGLNIYPEDIEAKLLNYSDIRDVVVLMDQQPDEPKLTAVVLTTRDDAYVNQIIRELNTMLASHQTIQNHIIWPDSDFPRTATRKVRRQLVQDAVNERKTDTPFIPSNDSSVIQTIIRQVSGSAKPITDDLIIASNLAIDSIKRLELVTLIEEKLLVAIDETAIDGTTTVGQLAAIVAVARMASASAGRTQPRGLTTDKLGLFLQSVIQAILLLLVSHYQKLTATGWTKPTEPVIYVANHTSHLDAPTFMRLAGFSGRQRLVIAAAADYFFTTRLKSWLSRNLLHAVPVEREGSVRGSLERIGHELSLGRSVVIFPEGSRSKTGKLEQFKPGVGLLAASLQVPVVPIRLSGNYRLLPKGARWPKRGTTKVLVGEPRRYSVSQTPDDIAQDLQRAIENL